MARITGRLLRLEVDGTDFSDQVSVAQIESAEADSDFVTLADARSGGGREYRLVITMAQDPSAGTLWSEVFDNVGDQVPFAIAPFNNAAASAAEPHFEGTATISEPDGVLIGGEASTSAAPLTTEVSWLMTGRPVKVTA